MLTVEDDWTQVSLDSKVGKYFRLWEVTKGDPARAIRDRDVKARVLRLARLLDQVREDWGEPICVTSWYRPPAVNARIGGTPNSMHITGGAADIYPCRGRGLEFEHWLDRRWQYALGRGQRSGRGFSHVDLREGRLRWDY